MIVAPATTPGGPDAAPASSTPAPSNPKTLIEQRDEEFKKCNVRFDAARVRINVGGTLFNTTMQTLKSDNLMYIDATLQLHRAAPLFVSDSTEAYLTYERDPELFKYILNYLRAPKSWVWPEYKFRCAVLREAEFYGVEPLMKQFPSYTKAADSMRRDMPSFVMLFEEGRSNVSLRIPWMIARLICKYFPMDFSNSVRAALDKSGRVCVGYGYVYNLIDKVIYSLSMLGFRVSAVANPNKTHTQYIFEAM